MRTHLRLVAVILAGIGFASCSSDPTDGKSGFDNSKPQLFSKLQSYQPEIQGPQIVFEGETINLALINVPEEVTRLRWRVDGMILPTESNQISFEAQITESHRFDLEIYFQDGDILTTPYFVTVIGYQDGLSCLKDLKIQTESVFFDDESITASLTDPACLSGRMSGARWSIVNQNGVSGLTREHNFGVLPVDQYILTAEVFARDTTTLLFTLRYVVSVVPRPESPDVCPVEGAEQIISETESEVEVSCGLGGKKTQVQKVTTKNICQRALDGNLDWVLAPAVTEIISESECQGQFCVVSGEGEDTEVLVDGEIKLGLISGDEVENLTCQFQEEGFYKKYNSLRDIQCKNGVLDVIQVYRSDVIEEKLCPEYSWVAQDSWSECTADCGGTQKRDYLCQDQYQTTAASERCERVSLEVESRVCDKNPEAAAYQTKNEVEEQANSSQKCPAKQIGSVIKKRTATTIENYACVNHEVVKVDENTTFSDWETEFLCRDYVAKRCSHDSLSIDQAKGRWQWMLKCQNSLPEVKRFLDEHQEIGIRDNKGRSFDSKRPLYATFMQIVKGKEVVWKAPIKANAECTMPETGFVAAVCVSSCATPDQQILVKEHSKKLPAFLRFDEVYNKNIPLVMTLRTPNLNKKNNLTHSKVDQWVTEVIDTLHDIKVVNLESGGQLKLTPNHPMVMPDGSLKLVQDLTVGESLVQTNGRQDRILEISDIKHFGKVYNVFTQSASPQHNVVIINGYMSGSAMFQNEAANLINRRIFRSKLTSGVK